MGKILFGKFFSTYVWGNMLAIVIFILLLCFGVRFGMSYYTLHGESIVVPNVVNKQFDEAERIMDSLGLTIEVSDTGYVKSLPPDCILEQTPVGGKRVKSTHVIYVTINAASAPSLVLPDLVDNSSLREAQARLLSMGFTLGDPQYRPGEKDWVYGITVNGKPVNAGDRIPKDAKLVIIAGDGTRDYVDSAQIDDEEFDDGNTSEPEDDGRLPGEPPAPKGYKYEDRWVEVPVDENGNELPATSSHESHEATEPSAPAATKPDNK